MPFPNIKGFKQTTKLLEIILYYIYYKNALEENRERKWPKQKAPSLKTLYLMKQKKLPEQSGS